MSNFQKYIGVEVRTFAQIDLTAVPGVVYDFGTLPVPAGFFQSDAGPATGVFDNAVGPVTSNVISRSGSYVFTTSGAPTAGTWAPPQLAYDLTGASFGCTVAGTPGTWVALTAQSGTFARQADVGTPLFYDDFSGAADGPIAGRVSPSGNTWTDGGGLVAPYVSGGMLRANPSDSTYSSYYATIDLGSAPSWFRMVADFDLIGGNDGSLNGGGTMVSCSTSDLGNNVVHNAALLHFVQSYLRYDIGITSLYPVEGLHSQSSSTNAKAVMATLTSGSTAVVATAGTFSATEQPVGVTGTGVPANATLTYVDDTHATLSAVATASGKVLLQVNEPMRTDGSRTYHMEMIADAESGEVTLLLPNERIVSFKVATRVDAATVTNGSATVLDPTITTTSIGQAVSGTGIPAGSYVGTVVPLTSFTLTSSRTSQVDVLATADASTVTVGSPLSAYMSRYFIWEGQRGGSSSRPVIRYKRVAVYSRNDSAQPGIMTRLGRSLGRSLYGYRNTFYQTKIGQVASSAGLLPGLALGSAEDTYLYRAATGVLGSDGALQAAALAVKAGSADTSRTLDPVTDGMLVCNGSNITHTLPLAGLCPNGKIFILKNVNSTALTVQTSGSEKFDGGTGTISVPSLSSVLILCNGNNSWWPIGQFASPVYAPSGTPTVWAGVNAGDRTDTVTVTSGSATVTDTAITANDQGRTVTGTGIPASTFVGTVSVGASFLLSSSSTSQVDVLATANGTSAVIGGAAAPAPTLNTGSTDSRGTILWGTGASPLATGEMIRVKFSATLSKTPAGLVLTQAHPSNSPGNQSYLHPTASSSSGALVLGTTGFSLYASAPGSAKASGTYRTFYQLVF